MPAFSLSVNGQSKQVDVPGGMPLLWVLRDVLDLTGTKFGCGEGLCGACTVHLDGQPVRSCSIAVEQAAKGKITTIEGLSNDLSHPIQKAWQALEVPQCGYCQSGQIMAAAALLKETPQPSDEQIDSAMSANICRCGTYERIRKAIHLAANGGAR